MSIARSVSDFSHASTVAGIREVGGDAAINSERNSGPLASSILASNDVMVDRTGQYTKRSNLTRGVGWILTFALLCGCQPEAPVADSRTGRPQELPAVQAKVMKVEPSPWPSSVRTQGSLIADEVTVVGAKVAGRVEELHADLGDFVAAGEPLATLDQHEFRLGVTLAKAQLLQARAALGLKEGEPVEKLIPQNSPPVREAKAVWDEMKAKTGRLQQLRAGNAISAEEFDQAVAAEQVASARHASALNGVLERIAHIHVRTAEVSLAQQRLDDAVIVAPFEGRVQERHVAPGTFVQVGDPIVTFVRSSKLRFRGTMPERHSHRLALDQRVTLRVASITEPIEARITRISPVVQQQVRSVIFEAEVDNRDGRLGAGLFAEAEVVVDPDARALLVPKSSLLEFAGAEKVWKVVKGEAQEQLVQTGRRRDEWVEIVDGLSAGDLILVEAGRGSVARVEPILVDVMSERRDGAAVPIPLSRDVTKALPQSFANPPEEPVDSSAASE